MINVTVDKAKQTIIEWLYTAEPNQLAEILSEFVYASTVVVVIHKDDALHTGKVLATITPKTESLSDFVSDITEAIEQFILRYKNSSNDLTEIRQDLHNSLQKLADAIVRAKP